MTQLVSRATIRAMARADYDAGQPREGHSFNWHAACLPDYYAEYDRCASQVSNFTPAAKMRVDAAQGATA